MAMLGGRDWLVIALLVMLTLNACGIVFITIDAAISYAGTTPEAEFVLNVKDRPVLETVHQVWQARATGISEFDFDGVHYVIEDLPKEYVDYSSWWVRMP